VVPQHAMHGEGQYLRTYHRQLAETKQLPTGSPPPVTYDEDRCKTPCINEANQ